MRVGVIWENFQFGGVTTHLENLINNKIFKNYEFVIFTNKTNKAVFKLKKKIYNKKVKFEFYNSLNVIYFNYKFLKLIFFSLRPFLFLLSVFQFHKILKKHELDILLGNCGGYGDFRSEVSAIVSASFLRIPVKLLLIHHSYTKPLFWQMFIKFFDRILSRNLQGIIFVSKAVKNNIKRNTFLLKKNLPIKIIYNGVKIKKSEKGLINLNKIFKKNKNNFKIGMISRIEKNKGQDDLVESYSKLPEKIRKKIVIYFIGEGSGIFISNLKKRISELNFKENFIFTGFLNSESFKIAKKLNLLVSLTKDFEGFGLSLAEALSVKTPVLATKVGGVTEFLNKKNSVLIEPNNLKEVSIALKDFVKNHKKWKKQAAVGQRLIKHKFSANKMSKNFFTYFESFFIRT